MITMIDVSSVFWPAWFQTKSGIRAYENAVEKVDWYWRDNPRTVVCADSPVSKRKEWCASYKAQREEKPAEALDALVSLLRRVHAWGVPVVECQGFEGEDIVSSLVSQAWPEPVQIVGVDKDLYALISDTVWIAGKSGIIDSNACFNRWGVVPSQMTDFLALTGDAADNIQGCPNCGPGRAADLLERFETLDSLRAASDADILSVRGVGKKTLDSLRAWDPTLALRLVRLLDDAPVTLETLWSTST
jgi:DNA polymerase I